MTTEEAILDLKQNPTFADLVINTYLDDPVSDAARRFVRSEEWIAIQEIVGPPEPGAMVLDLGAGRGVVSFAFATVGWNVTALEPDPSDIVGLGSMKQLISQTGVEFALVNAWGETLPFEDNVFDVVYCRQVLHHALNLDQLIVEMVRVLKPGGKFLATREHVLQREDQLDQFLASHPVHRRAGGEHAFTLNTYMNALKLAGLENITVMRPWDSPINIFPESVKNLENKLHRRLRVVPRRMIKPWMIAAIGRMRAEAPGVMYSFAGSKPV